jgi:hypothetical protein
MWVLILQSCCMAVALVTVLPASTMPTYCRVVSLAWFTDVAPRPCGADRWFHSSRLARSSDDTPHGFSSIQASGESGSRGTPKVSQSWLYTWTGTCQRLARASPRSLTAFRSCSWRTGRSARWVLRTREPNRLRDEATRDARPASRTEDELTGQVGHLQPAADAMADRLMARYLCTRSSVS